MLIAAQEKRPADGRDGSTYGQLVSAGLEANDDEPQTHEVRVCHRRGRLVDRQGPRQRVGRSPARGAQASRHVREARPLHQRRPRDDEPVPARRGLRDRRRGRDRPRPRALRALHDGAHDAPEQFHDRAYLRERHLQGTSGRVPRGDGAGHPAHHRPDQGEGQGRHGRRGRRHHRDRRHRGRHRVATVPRGRAPDEDRGRAPECL